MKSLLTIGTLGLLLASQAALADVKSFDTHHLSHEVNLTGDEALALYNSMQTLVKSPYNWTVLRNFSCAIAPDAKTLCSYVGGEPQVSGYEYIASGSALEAVFKALTAKVAAVEDATAPGYFNTLPAAVSCSNDPGYSTKCNLTFDLGYPTDTFAVDSLRVPAIADLLKALPSSFNVADPASGVATYVIDNHFTATEGSIGSHGSPTTLHQISVIRSGDHYIKYDNAGFEGVFHAINAAHVYRKLNHGYRNQVIACTQPLQGDHIVATCTVTETN